MEAKQYLFRVVLIFLQRIVRSDFITNAPIFLSNVSPILYHEACFSSSVCLDRSEDDVLYVTCESCRNAGGVELKINRCNVSNRSVLFDRNCSLLGGFCASVNENRSVCVPAVPYNDNWWPEAVPSTFQNCRENCGVDRAFFRSWNESGGYEKTCLCPHGNNVNPTTLLKFPSVLDNYEIYRLLNRKPFPFCYFEQCNRVIDYTGRFLRENFTDVVLKKRPEVLVMAFKPRSGEVKTACSTNVYSPPVVVHSDSLEEDEMHCWDQDSLLYLYPEQLPIFYYERKDRLRD